MPLNMKVVPLTKHTTFVLGEFEVLGETWRTRQKYRLTLEGKGGIQGVLSGV
jgi:hypothetical protein